MTLSPAIQPGIVLSVDFPSMGKMDVGFVVENTLREEGRIDIKNQDSRTGNIYSITIMNTLCVYSARQRELGDVSDAVRSRG